MANWIYIVESNCSDTKRESEYNDWYNNTHVPDILKEADFIHATRYEALHPGPGQAKFVALFDLATDDIERTLKVHEQTEAALKAGGRVSELLVIVTRTAFRRLSERDK
jgi:hypothetical protein